VKQPPLKLLLLEVLLILVSYGVIPRLFVPLAAQEVRPFNSPISHPLPTAPLPVLVNGTLRVEVKAGSDSKGWAAKIASPHESVALVVVNSSRIDGDTWVLFLMPNGTLHPGLYSLNIAYSDGAKSVNHTQPRCVWVLKEWPKKLRIGQITDTHLPYGADIFATFIYEMNLIYPDMIVHTGDLVDVETISSAWMYLQRILNWSLVASYFLPGNHDHSGQKGSFYQEFCGLLNYSVVIGDFLFIALNTGEEGYVQQSQLDWAEQILKKNKQSVTANI